jgi:hypothetical protein
MDEFSLAPGRARVLRITTALVLALALTTVLGAATAAAAPSTTELTCSDLEPVAGSTVTCKTVVTGGGPSKTVRFEQIGFAEFTPRTCQLLPFTKTSSVCVVKLRVLAAGPLTIFASYLANTEEDFSSDSEEFMVEPGGSIRVECTPEFGFVGELSHCEAVVPNTPGINQPPKGLVQFRSLSEFLGERAGGIDPECELEPTPSGARCAVRFEPSTAGMVAVIADYKGDASHPAQFGSVQYLVFEQHETKTSAKCDSPTPLLRTTMLCTVSVLNLDATGGPPTGTVDFREEEPESGSFPDTGPFCQLEADEAEEEKARESFCSVLYRPTKLGPQTLEVQFLGSERFDFGEPAFINLDVQSPRPTSASLTCLPTRGSFPGICLVTVADTTASPTSPTGTVKLNVPSTVKLNRETCDLAANLASPSSSSCAFGYTMSAIGSAPVVAEYSGGAKGHLASSANGTASRQS